MWIGVWVVLLHIYSWRLKRMYLAGNVLVSAVAGSGFLLGAYAGGNVMAGAIPAAFTFFFVMGREIVKDTDDIEGDRACRARTFPIVSGRRAALTTALVIFLALCISIPVPAFVGMYGIAYALIMLLSVVPILLDIDMDHSQGALARDREHAPQDRDVLRLHRVLLRASKVKRDSNQGEALR